MLINLLSLLLSITMFFGTLFGAAYTDVMPEEPDFPIIDCDARIDGTIRIMSFNVRCADVNGTQPNQRRLLVPIEILKVSPDSVGLQEATPEWMSSIKSNLPGYSYVGEGREGGNKGEYSAIFYNSRKWKLIDSGTFWLSETPDEVSKAWGADCIRICTWAELQNKKTGEKYVHVNSHFDHVSDLARENSAKMITEFISGKFTDIPVVFTADLNSLPNGIAYKTMTTILKDCGLAAADANGYGTFHNTHPETHKDYIIDYVLCKPELEVKTYRTVTSGVNRRFVSDHFPIYADISLTSTEE